MADILEYGAQCYGFDFENALPIYSGSNKIYKFKKDALYCYLRISEHPASYIAAEIDWLVYLKDSIAVPEPIFSVNSNLTETFQSEGKSYVLCAFKELDGLLWDKNNNTKWNETVFYHWGQAIGKIHCLTKNYTPGDNIARRPHLENDLYSPQKIHYIPSAANILKELIKEILALPKDKDSYGLIHCDMHQQNFLIGKDSISVLDFDDCIYGWFVYDIAIALYHGLWWGIPDNVSNKNDFAQKMIQSFLKGYLSENHLNRFWLSKIPLFMQFRQISALTWFARPDNLDTILNIDLFKIQYDVKKHISFIEQGLFFEGCALKESDFTNY